MAYHKIDAVIKITERCNINCTYCYMFNKSSSLFEAKPKQMSLETAKAVAAFLLNSARETGAEIVRVIFHGGEPMMMRPADFEAICQTFIATITPEKALQFSMQTNATLVDERWIALIERYQISIGISIDGDQAANDRHRIDHQGRGTYDRTIAGARQLFAASEAGRIATPAALCVIDPAADGAQTFLHLVQDAGFRWIDFLLPIDTRDETPPDVALRVGTYLEQVFEAWGALGDKRISIRFFDQFYTFMTGFDRPSGRTIAATKGGTLILTIASDGTYGPDDTLRVVSDDLFAFDCRAIPIGTYLADPAIAAIYEAAWKPPQACSGCSWAAYCVGGSANGRLVNRYARDGGFEHRSALCEGLDHIYGVLARQLLVKGYPREAMFERLNTVAEQVLGYEAA